MTTIETVQANESRGQTLPDFAVGIAVFLVTVAFVAVFIPQLALPFEDQEQPAVAERITSELGTELLTERSTSSALNESATREFFDKSEDEALEYVGVATGNRTGWYGLNVTLRAGGGPDSAVLCNPDGDAWIGDDCATASSGDYFAVGQSPPDDGRSVATARRMLFADDLDVVLVVRVW